MKIAVIGSGISGLSATWELNRAGHAVALYEAHDTPGGHTATVTVDAPGGPLNIDTGFIVYNEPTYPNLTRLFAELGVETQSSDMSFSSSCRACRVEYGTRGLGGFFAQRDLALRPSYLRMFPDILRFYRDARGILDGPEPNGLTLGAYLDDEPAGWLGFAPRSRLPRLARSRTIPQVDEIDAWAILCFNVRSGYRRRGIATALLDGLVVYARDRGAPALEAYPIDAAGGRVDSGFGYVGLTTWFEAAGFTRVVETDARSAGRPRILMRLPL